jgi:serine/threonine-protein kinase
MTDDPRLQQLLDELHESQATPEEVCASCPELLPEVRRRWAEIRCVQAELDALFPPSSVHSTPSPTILPSDDTLPDVPGYKVEGLLGHGGVGVVYRAWHLRLNRPVALKMLLAGAHAQLKERERFEREAEAVAALRHPNIVQIYDVGDVNGHAYFTMEFVEGGSLAEAIQGVPQPAHQAAALIAVLAEAIHVAHQNGIVHRDLKPGNIMLTPDGTPKVTDFGLAWRFRGDADLTITGVPLGTPSYMSPCQARGDKTATGPATDIWALGAILYELLTGRPPFRSDTPSATLHQVVSEEPVPPRRLNPRIPRDLQTICLKCLYKEPHKRYASAQALADDLRRFERGEPIKARPVGLFERAVRWVRRRPALAGAVALGLLLASALVATVFRRHAEQTTLRATAVAYAEADLNESGRLLNRGELKASAAVLERAKERLGEYIPPELRDRLSTAIGNLELVTQLDAIRLERALVKPRAEVLDVLVMPATAAQEGNGPPDETQSGRHYADAFREAGIGAPGADPAAAAALVSTSSVSKALVAALDDWAACATDRDQQAWVLAVVRQADPDPWRDRVRDPATWDNAEALRDLASGAPVDQQSPQLLAVFGARLRANNIDAVPFLTRVVAAYPNDFWANIETGNAHLQQSKAAEASSYYRAALSLRPGTASIHYALGCMYLGLHHWDPCVAELEQAIRLNPANAWSVNRLGVAYQWMGGHDDDAIAQFHKSIRLDPNIGWTHHHLAVSLERNGRFDEAAEEFREAVRLSPEKLGEWTWDVRRVLIRHGRGAEAAADWKKELAALPPAHDDWNGYAELCLYLGDDAEYRRVRGDLLEQFGSSTDATVAERVGRACLLLPGTEEELRQAAALTERAVNSKGSQYDWLRPYFRFAKGLASYRQGRFVDAIAIMTGDASKAAEYMGPSPRLVTIMALYQIQKKDEARELFAEAVRSYDWNTEKAGSREAWIAHILRREAEAMIKEDDEPAVQENK